MTTATKDHARIVKRAAAILLAMPTLLAGVLPCFAINPPPPELCVRDMQSKSMKYADCINAADIAFRKKRDVDKHTAALAKCGEKYATVWTDMAGCDYTTTQQGLQDYLDAAVGGITQTLDGAPLPVDVATCNTDLGTCQQQGATCATDLGTCQQNLTACELLGSGSGGLPKTGQTTCWDNNGVVACQNNGGDGETQAGMARSYTDNGDGTITDNTTRLMWESLDGGPGVHSMFDHYTWHDAVATKIATLNSMNFAGHDDWRLPNVLELQALVDYGRVPAINAVFDAGCAFGCVAPACACPGNAVWSSTSVFAGGPTNAQEVEFSDGETYGFPKTGSYDVRAVRSLP